MKLIELVYRLSVCYTIIFSVFVIILVIIWIVSKLPLIDRFTDRMIFKFLDMIGEREI